MKTPKPEPVEGVSEMWIPKMRVELEVSFEAGSNAEDAERWAAQVKGILERAFVVPRDVQVELLKGDRTWQE